MAVHDICADVAALIYPMPNRTDETDDDAYQAMAEAAWQEREELAEQLRLSLQEGGVDPLLSVLRQRRGDQLQAEADIRLLIAYARRFTSPQPYKLSDLASAGGMSISGARIAYDDDEIAQVAKVLGRSPAGGSAPASTSG